MSLRLYGDSGVELSSEVVAAEACSAIGTSLRMAMMLPSRLLRRRTRLESGAGHTARREQGETGPAGCHKGTIGKW